MKLLYTTSATFPSYRANRIQIANMARAWTNILRENFMLGIGRCEDNSLKGINFIEMGEKARSYELAWKYLKYAKENKFTNIYCREERMLFFMVLYNIFFFKLHVAMCYEMHHLLYTNSWWFKSLLKKINLIVSITGGMKGILIRNGYPSEKVLVAPDAVDIKLFQSISITKEQARQKIGLPVDKKIVIYTGSLSEPWKGVEVLYGASKKFDNKYLFLIVGSKAHHVEYFRSLYPDRPNLIFIGHRPHDEIPLYLKCADIAVLPNSGKNEISRIATSPMKLFEYMASTIPIVASDVPSIREILGPQNAILVEPDDPESLASGIRQAIKDKEKAKKVAERAFLDVSVNTWDMRAKNIIAFF